MREIQLEGEFLKLMPVCHRCLSLVMKLFEAAARIDVEKAKAKALAPCDDIFGFARLQCKAS